MALSLSDLQTPLTRDQVRTSLLGYLADFGFPVDSWQDEGAARGLVEMCAALGASLSERVAELASMAFVSTSTGSFLTALVRSHYDEERSPAVASVFDVTLTNASTTSYGTIPAGQVVVQNSEGVTFASTESVNLSAGSTTDVEFAAQIPGSSGNIAAGTLQLVTPFAGVSATFAGTFTTVGADEEDDAPLRERAVAKWGTLRIEKTAAGLLSLARAAAPNVHSVGVDDQNPRGAGTVDVYLAAENATAGGSDVTAVQAALDDAIFGNGSEDQLVQAFAAPTTTQNLAATVYVRGTTSAAATTALTAAWRAFLVTIPIGGFDLSPGPTNVIQVGQIVEALSNVTGVVSVSVTTPAADVTVTSNRKVLEGSIAFTVVVLAS